MDHPDKCLCQFCCMSRLSNIFNNKKEKPENKKGDADVKNSKKIINNCE